MSTPNFHNRKASRIFASECEHEFDYEDLILNVQSALPKATPADRSEPDSLRSYEGQVFAEIERIIGKWGITISLIVRGGYYGGLNLDWRVDITDQYEGDNFEWGEDAISATADNYIQKQIAKIEKIFAQFTTPLICVGIFSNGEAVYEKASRLGLAPAS